MIDERLASDDRFNRYDRRSISWIPRERATRGAARPFDRDRARATFVQWRATISYARPRLHEQLPSAMTLPEARFWFYAFTSFAAARLRLFGDTSGPVTDDARVQIRAEADRELSTVDLDSTIDVGFVSARLRGVQIRSALFLPLGLLFDVPDLLELMDARPKESAFGSGLACFVVPYLDDAGFERLRGRVESAVERYLREGPQTDTWPGSNAPPEIALYPALHLRPLMPVLFNLVRNGNGLGLDWAGLRGLVLGQPSAPDVLAAGEALPLRFYDARGVREWLAATGEAGLAHAMRHTSDYDYGDTADRIGALGMLGTPATARAMLNLTRRKGFAPHARAWLAAHMDPALPVLVKAAGSRTASGDVAVELLRTHADAGGRGEVERCASAAVRDVVFRVALTAELEWLDAVPKRPKPVPWLYADALPILQLEGRTAGEEQTPAIVEALRASSLTAVDPRLAALRAAAEPRSAEAWALALFRQWLRANAPAADRWAMSVLGTFGGDESVLALVPLIRRWPGEAQHTRAVFGLDVLRTIGSELALTQIAGLAQRLPFAALKKRAAECIEEIALARELSRDRLEDRIVPTLDFTAAGEREFAYRGVTYSIRLNASLAPSLVDPAGRLLRDLPKAEDDAGERAQWVLLKKQLRELANVQRMRLERAMVAQRSWFGDEFTRFVVNHPLVGRLARDLVWIVDSVKGDARFFSIEPGGLLDAGAQAIALSPRAGVRVAHRLEMNEDELARWEQRFAGRAQPFAQLERIAYRLDALERRGSHISRFADASAPETTFTSRLKARGWSRGTVADGGMYGFHSKYFERADVHAVITHDGIVVGYRRPDARVGEIGCTFYRGADFEPSLDHGRLALDDVAPVAISEVIADLAFVFGP